MGKSALDSLSQYDTDHGRKFGSSLPAGLSTTQKCLKNTLMGLNLFFFVLAIILISVGAWAVQSNTLSFAGGANGLAGGIVAMGTFVMLISFLGCCGAFRENRCLLGIYVVVLGLVVLIQFILGVVIASTNPEELANEGWRSANNNVKVDLQKQFSCCGLKVYNATDRGVPCPDLAKFPTSNRACLSAIKADLKKYVTGVAAVGILFAFFEFTGLIAALCLMRGIRVATMEKDGDDSQNYA